MSAPEHKAAAGRETRKALAIYPTAAKLNHACAPNMALRFDGAVLTVRAISPLAAGAPLRHCYGPQVHCCPCVSLVSLQNSAARQGLSCQAAGYQDAHSGAQGSAAAAVSFPVQLQRV